jgi:hypothetical protein
MKQLIDIRTDYAGLMMVPTGVGITHQMDCSGFSLILREVGLTLLPPLTK